VTKDRSSPPPEQPLEGRVLSAVNRVFRERLTCDTEEQLAKTCLAVAEDLTASKFGFIGEINPRGRFDTIALSDPGWDACRLPHSDAVVSIKDMEIRGIWGDVIRTGAPVIADDPPHHASAVGVPEGHPPLTAVLGVPLQRGDETVGVISLGNKEGGYTQADVDAVQDLSVAIVEALASRRAQDQLGRQTEEILEISTPVMQVWEGIVVAPLIGTLDSRRTQQFMERLLQAIVDTRSPVALVDITGVPAVDTLTAQNLIEAVAAARMLGSNVILTGLRPNIAQTLVQLGVDMRDIDTSASLAAGLKLALARAGLEIGPAPDGNPPPLAADGDETPPAVPDMEEIS